MTTTLVPSVAPGRPGRAERAALGKSLRKSVPLAAHAELLDDDRDPITILEAQATSRVPELVPIRYGRMGVSPFTFYRGAAAVMAHDLSAGPRTDLVTQLCGDAHLSNFGMFASPERKLVFDLNDFDETLPGPFEWDVKRLAASLEVAARDNGLTGLDRRTVVVGAVEAYRTGIRDLATRTNLGVWYSQVDAEQVLADLARNLDKLAVQRTRKAVAKAQTRDSVQAFAKLASGDGGTARIISETPLIVPIEDLLPQRGVDEVYASLRALLVEYGDTLPSDRRHLLHQFDLVHVARKVVGVGSVGTRAWILLLQGADGSGPALPAGEGGAAVGAVRRAGRERVRAPGRAGGGGPAPDAGDVGHLPGMGAHAGHRRRLAGLLRPTAQGLEGLRRRRAAAAGRAEGLCPALRLDPGACPCPVRRPGRDRLLPRPQARLRRGDRRLRGGLRRPHRARLRRAGRRRHRGPAGLPARALTPRRNPRRPPSSPATQEPRPMAATTPEPTSGGTASDTDLAAEVERLREENERLVAARPRRRRFNGRAVASVVVMVVAAVLLLPSVIAFWGQRTLLDTDRYVSTVAPLAQDPTIRTAVGDALTTQLLAAADLQTRVSDLLPDRAKPLAGPIASGVGSFIGDQVQNILASDQFAQLWVQINTRAQEALVSALDGKPVGGVSLQGSQIVLDTGVVVERVRDELVARGVTILEGVPIPPRLDRQIVLLDDAQVQQVQNIYSFARPLAQWLIWVVVVLFVAAVVLARRRWRAVAVVGWVLVVEAVLLRLGLSVGQTVFDNQLSGTALGPASDAFYTTLLTYLVLAFRTLFVLGLLLALIGWYGGGSGSAVKARALVSAGLGHAGARIGPGTGDRHVGGALPDGVARGRAAARRPRARRRRPDQCRVAVLDGPGGGDPVRRDRAAGGPGDGDRVGVRARRRRDRRGPDRRPGAARVAELSVRAPVGC